jgi:hypothetical protein
MLHAGLTVHPACDDDVADVSRRSRFASESSELPGSGRRHPDGSALCAETKFNSQLEAERCVPKSDHPHMGAPSD